MSRSAACHHRGTQVASTSLCVPALSEISRINLKMVEQSSAKSDAEHPSPMNSDEEDEVFKDCFETKVVQSMEDSLESKALAASLFKENEVVGALNKTVSPFTRHPRARPNTGRSSISTWGCASSSQPPPHLLTNHPLTRRRSAQIYLRK